MLEGISKILDGAAIAPILVEVPGRILRRAAQELATSWSPAILVNDDEPGYEVQLADAVAAGQRVVLVIENPRTIEDFIHTLRYSDNRQTEMAYVKNRYVRVNSAFRLCCVLKQASALSRSDPPVLSKTDPPSLI